MALSGERGTENGASPTLLMRRQCAMVFLYIRVQRIAAVRIPALHGAVAPEIAPRATVLL